MLLLLRSRWVQVLMRSARTGRVDIVNMPITTYPGVWLIHTSRRCWLQVSLGLIQHCCAHYFVFLAVHDQQTQHHCMARVCAQTGQAIAAPLLPEELFIVASDWRSSAYLEVHQRHHQQAHAQHHKEAQRAHAACLMVSKATSSWGLPRRSTEASGPGYERSTAAEVLPSIEDRQELAAAAWRVAHQQLLLSAHVSRMC